MSLHTVLIFQKWQQVRNIFLFAYIFVGIVACSEKSSQSKLIEASEQVVERFENARTDFDAVAIESSLGLSAEFKEVIDLASKKNLSESEQKRIVEFLDREKKKNDQTDIILIEMIQSSAQVFAFFSVLSNVCENTSLKLLTLEITSNIERIDFGYVNQNFDIIYSSYLTEYESELESKVSEQECKKFSVDIHKLEKQLDYLKTFKGFKTRN